MDIILEWFTIIFLAVFVASIVVFNLARLFYGIKCFKVEDCSHRDCPFRIFCYKYVEAYTDEDIERIMKMLEEKAQNEWKDEIERAKEREMKEKKESKT